MKYNDLSSEEKVLVNRHIHAQSTEKGRVKAIEEKYYMPIAIMQIELNKLYWSTK